MIKPRRIGHATFETPDLQKMIDYYTQVMGLVLAEREKDRAFLTTQIGLLAIQLNKGDVERCTTLSFEVAPGPISARWRASSRTRASRASCATIPFPASAGC